MDLCAWAVDIGGWLLDASKTMLYLRGPAELALSADDPAPNYFLKHGLPMFFILMAAEAAVAVCRQHEEGKRGKVSGTPHARPSFETVLQRADRPRLNHHVASIVVGAVQTVILAGFDLVGLSFTQGSYQYVYEHFRLWTIEPKDSPILCWVVLLLGVDLGYYWYHRTLHEWHLPWTAHSVHHSGEDYNTATGLRQGIFQPLFSPPFFCWLALLGFPPVVFGAHHELNTLYMYWVHTELINRLPFGLEYVLNSPMAHRMHHRPPGNCNYAGVFIIWDRIFGTYIPELTQRDWYGLAAPVQTFDPLVLNTQHFQKIWSIWRSGRGLRALVTRRPVCYPGRPFSLRQLLEPIPSCLDPKQPHPISAKWDGENPMSWTATGLVAMTAVGGVIGVVGLLVGLSQLPRYVAVVVTGIAVCALRALGCVCDQRADWRMTCCSAIVLMGALLCIESSFLQDQ